MKYARALVVSACTLAMSCASTMIYSNPPGAKLWIDGEAVGLTPYLYADGKTIFASTKVRLEAPGYAPLETKIRREQVAFPRVLASIFLLPILWACDYKPEYWFYLTNPSAEHFPPESR